MNKFILSLQVRVGELINKIIRIYGRQELRGMLWKLKPIKWSHEDQRNSKTACLIIGTSRTSAQFLLTAYLWRIHLPLSIPIKLMHDGPLSKDTFILASYLFGKHVELVDICSLIPDFVASEDEKFYTFIKIHRFGRKFLAIYTLSHHYDLIYSDDDILLFDTPHELINASSGKTYFLYSPDTSGSQCPMHREMVIHAKSFGVLPFSDFQAGLLYLKKDSLTRETIDKYLFPWTPENDMNFSEQTLLSLAMAEHRNYTKILDSEKYINNASKGRFIWEKDINYFNKNIVLRHFMGTVRHRYFFAARKIVNNLK